jgi:hypothetical protein
MTLLMIADVEALGPIDGMGERHADGSYVRLYVKGDGQYGNHYRISRGAAETLIAELQGVLGQAADGIEQSHKRQQLMSDIGETIGWAVKQMHNGARVRRRGWSGKGMWLALIRGSEWDMPREKDLRLSKPGGMEDGYERRADFVAMRAANGDLVPWLCSQSDLLAVDWELAK